MNLATTEFRGKNNVNQIPYELAIEDLAAR